MKIDHRKMFRSNGLIDDFVVYGSPDDYLLFSDLVQKAVDSKQTIPMLSETDISIEITCDNSEETELFTSFQNRDNEYFSMDDWEHRNILKVEANALALKELSLFLKDLSGRGIGYSYLSEYSENYGYSSLSPEWRLHVEHT